MVKFLTLLFYARLPRLPFLLGNEDKKGKSLINK